MGSSGRIAGRLAKTLAAAVTALALVLVANTLRRGAPARPDVPPAPSDTSDPSLAVDHLAAAVRIPTVSHATAAPDATSPGEDDESQFRALVDLIERTYPKVHQTLTREVLGPRALLYTWTGTDPSLRPALFAAHMDVVPVEEASASKWSHPPFDGTVEGGFVWGRGTLDDKGALVCLLEAAESLARDGYRPKRTIYLAFGGDEEVGGAQGAAKIVAALAGHDVHLDYVLDEGMSVTDGFFPGASGPIGIVGIAEKGYVSVELVAESQAGHSSTPPATTAIGLLAEAIARLDANPMPARLDGPPRKLIEALAPEMPFSKRVAASNLWLLEPVVLSIMSREPAQNASIRTTMAPTIIQGGVKDNVLPATARAVLNFRILPGDTVDQVVAHTTRVVADDRVHVKKLDETATEPSPVASTDSRAFHLLDRAIRQIFPVATVAPTLVLGATDGRRYEKIAGGVYHFTPFVMRPEDIQRVHGIDERMSVDDVRRGVRFYKLLLRDGE